MHFLSVSGIICSFCAESVDIQYFQLPAELPSAKLQKHVLQEKDYNILFNTISFAILTNGFFSIRQFDEWNCFHSSI